MSSARAWSWTRPATKPVICGEVARVELLEGAVVATPDGLDEGSVVRARRVGEHSGSSLHHDYAHLDEPVPITAGP